MAGVHAALIGVPTPGGSHDALRGVGADLEGWHARLRARGVPSDQIRMRHGDGVTRADVLDEVRNLAQRLKAEPDAHGLIVLAGHGGGDAALIHTSDGPVPASEVAGVLDAHIHDRGVLVIADVCAHRDAADGALPAPASLRAIDVVITAASPDHPAEEFLVDGSWQGAFTWAAHRVLDRWASAGESPNARMSPQQLRDQVALVLQGLGFGQRPSIAGPASAVTTPILGGIQGVVRAPLAPVATRQYDPGMAGYRVLELAHGGGGADTVVLTTGSPPSGYAPNREFWAALPADGDTLQTTSTGLPGSPPGNAYTTVWFNPGGPTQQFNNLQAGTGETLFSLTVSSAVVGYLMIGTGSPPKLDWYMKTPITKWFGLPCTFTKLTGAVSFTGQKRP